MFDSNEIHVLPVNDLREHEASAFCFCKPKRDTERPEVYIHNALDRREFYENNPGLTHA